MTDKKVYKKDLQLTMVRNGYIVKTVNATNEKDIYVFPSIASMVDYLMQHFEGGELTKDDVDKIINK